MTENVQGRTAKMIGILVTWSIRENHWSFP
jgi:hypothetical protein